MLSLHHRLATIPRLFVGSARYFSNSPVVARQFLMIAHDFTDDEALNRRMNARQAHLDRAETMKRRGQIILGGPLLTDDDKMNGSIIVYEANDEAELRGWLAEDPYVTGRVWNNIEIRRMKFTRLE